MKHSRRELAPGVWLTAIQTPKFKSGYWTVQFLAPLDGNASANALTPKVLRRGTVRYPGLNRLTAALDDLYGGAVEATVRKKGEVQSVGFAAAFLDDALVPGGEDLTRSAAGLLGELLLSPALENGAFRTDWLEGERTNLIDQIRSERNDKHDYAQQRTIELMYEGEGYGRNVRGTVESAEQVTPEGLYRRWQALLHTAPVELYYCGSAAPERVAGAWSEALAALPAGDRRPISQGEARPAAGAVRRFSDHLDVTQGKLVLGFRSGGVTIEHPSYPAFLVLNALYGGTAASKLFLNVREKRSLCYYASSGVDKLKGLMLVSSGVEFSRFQAAEDEILAQLEACRRGEITGDELDGAKRSLVSALRATLDVQGRLETFWLTQNVGGVTEGPEELARRIEQVSVSDVVEQAQRMELDVIYRMEGPDGTT